jgi:hypothetical protein
MMPDRRHRKLDAHLATGLSGSSDESAPDVPRITIASSRADAALVDAGAATVPGLHQRRRIRRSPHS